VLDYRIDLHVHQVSARPGIFRTATPAVAIATRVGNESGNGFATRTDLNRLSPKRRVVPECAKERNETVVLHIVWRLVTNVGELASVGAGAVHVTFGAIGVGVVVGTVATTWCV
jgi:hypothetical protein